MPLVSQEVAMSEVETKTENGVLHIRFNRPERLNAVNEELYRQTLDALEQAEQDAGIRCVVLSGNGRAFCAGADLKAHKTGRSREDRESYIRLGNNVCKRIQTLRVPVVAMVHGYAIGGGAEIATSADFLIIAEDAQLGFPEAAIGTYVGGGVTYRLPRLIGLRHAANLLLLGHRITGSQCLEIGLATEAPRADRLQERTNELVSRITRNAPISMALIKSALNSDQGQGDVFEKETLDLLAIMETRDWQEGVDAFAERRAPLFEGR